MYLLVDKSHNIIEMKGMSCVRSVWPEVQNCIRRAVINVSNG